MVACRRRENEAGEKGADHCSLRRDKCFEIRFSYRGIPSSSQRILTREFLTLGAKTKSVEERTGAAGGRGTLERMRSWWEATSGLVREQVSDDKTSAWATGPAKRSRSSWESEAPLPMKWW